MDKYFFKIHLNQPQEGPGSFNSTKTAIDYIRNKLPANPKILDIGCGSGRQTSSLAKLLPNSQITAFEILPTLINQAKSRFENEKINNQITLLNKSMLDIPFDDQKYDIVWSEGAIYFMGFENGLAVAKTILNLGGYIGFSHLAYFINDPDPELKAYWDKIGADIQHDNVYIDMIKKQGFEFVTSFHLPYEDWLSYYNPIKERMSELNQKYGEIPEYIQAVNDEEEEMGIISKYHQQYGYTFFIARNGKTIFLWNCDKAKIKNSAFYGQLFLGTVF